MDVLGKLLGGPHRVKLMRFVLLNPSLAFFAKEASARTAAPPAAARRELEFFRSIGLVRKDQKKRYLFNPAFPHVGPLKDLLMPRIAEQHDLLAKTFRGVGRVRLLLVAGLFLQEEESRADLILAGDGLKRTVIERIIRRMETDLGKEIRYSLFETREFLYRVSIYDKFIRDVLDYPHKMIVNKLPGVV